MDSQEVELQEAQGAHFVVHFAQAAQQAAHLPPNAAQGAQAHQALLGRRQERWEGQGHLEQVQNAEMGLKLLGEQKRLVSGQGKITRRTQRIQR